ncbi:hypothetical protein [Halosimplex pelagicum]|uniref:Transcriptional initiation protein Tat n=1 Tax=Halosimplex pelagicum TaxID=869886 RepID=A0A7D5PDU8_9EURY|nr:hypothetical protein [Halosimplex pelagicum]QLH84442.1 hypothetical protein HZS54_23595 [Halosimplex pelagicum]
MQRRTVLRGLAALAAGAGAGCTANREVPATAPEPPEGIATPADDPEPTPDRQPFVVPERAFRSGEDGDLVVELTVRNRAGVAREAVMTVTVEAGDRTFTPSRHVALQPEASRRFEIRFPVPEAELTGFSVSFDPGPPETPVPEETVTPYPGDGATPTDSPTPTDTGSTATATESGSTATDTSTGTGDADTGDGTPDTSTGSAE